MAPSRKTRANSSRQVVVPEVDEREIRKLKFISRTSRRNIQLVKEFISKADWSQVNNTVLKSKLSELAEYSSQYKDSTANLASYINDEDDVDQHLDEVAEIANIVSECRVALESRINIEPPMSVQNAGQSTEMVPHRPIIEARLPKVDVPQFNGKPEEWAAFYQMFSALVHDRRDLPPLVKFQYLLGAVKQSAFEMIKDFPLTAENYTEAMSLLKKRFDNPRLTVDRLIGSIFDLPQISLESAEALRAMLDKTVSAIKALANINYKLDPLADAMIVRILKAKLDSKSKELFETKADKHTFEELRDFLESRIPVLESIGKIKPKSIEKAKTATVRPNTDTKRRSSFITTASPSTSSSSSSTSSSQQVTTCPLCQGKHHLSRCDTFKALNTFDRWKKAKELRICVNCLYPGHYVKECRSSTCRECAQKHNTILHFVSKEPSKSGVPPSAENSKSPEKVQEPVVTNIAASRDHKVLPTASIIIYNQQGEKHIVRVVLDNCSTDHFVTKSCADKLGLRTTPISLPITGIGCSKTSVAAIAECRIQSRMSSYNCEIVANVVSKITASLPSIPIHQNIQKWVDEQGLAIADPDYASTQPVDMLLGVEIFFEILESKSLMIPSSKLKLVATKLGWIVAGSWGQRSQQNVAAVCNLSVNGMERFWETEELPFEKPRTDEHQKIENHFLKTHRRQENGRFVVRLPFRDNRDFISNCRSIAIKKFQNMERRGISEEYRRFMEEHQNLGHMKRAESPCKNGYFIPHFSVFTSGKFRVVFHASTKDAESPSLNEALMVGPPLQSDIFSILIRFRSYKFAFSTDIVKMYRQIAIHSEDYDYQRILWRSHPNESLEEYQLTTVTYGTAPASFLATRCLMQLATEHQDEFPLACRAIKEQSYVDDILVGASTLEEAVKTKCQLVQMLRKGCFELSKWRANHPKILEADTPLTAVAPLGDGKNNPSPTLGLNWNPTSDVLSFSKLEIPIPKDNEITKRVILSHTSKLYDPLGLIAPIILRGKLIFQQLWHSPGGWDDIVSQEVATAFRKFRQDLHSIEDIEIPRCIPTYTRDNVELHVFGDASNRAYAAVAYIRVKNNEIESALLCAKTRVAPIKPVTLARLELCASLLVAQLIDRISNDLGIEKSCCYAYSDSQIVLAWLSKHPSTWACYVANRVSQIHAIVKAENWRYIPSQQNPADVASRSCNVQSLRHHKLWWHGPDLLRQPDAPSLRAPKLPVDANLEKRKNATLIASSTPVDFKYFGCYMRTIRVYAYVLRFAVNTKLAVSDRKTGPLETLEIENALFRIVRFLQMSEFSSDYTLIKKGAELPKGSKFKALSPFIDKDSVIRVGGRLENAFIEYDCKHPIVLPARHQFTNLVIAFYHDVALHAGALGTHNAIRQKFWLLGGARDAVRTIVLKCTICLRYRVHKTAQQMGQLPIERVRPSYPFQVTGVDYAGPFTLKVRGGRCRTTLKAYVVIFVCFVVKAVHIEVAESLTLVDFISALRRFIGRRGYPAKIVSDNGTQFVGANNEIQTFLQTNEERIKNYAASMLIEWSFIPPRAPHMGGLWEAAVKSAKSHFKRIIGDQILTLNELQTIFIQIEAVLNSRPLSPISSDPNDLSPLTPGHFLVGRPLLHLPSKPTGEMVSFAPRWQLVQKMTLDFWERWRKDYLNHLTARNKWQNPTKNLEVGDLVIVKDDNAAPMNWSLGRIVKTYPGQDGYVRVADVRLKSGILKRPIVKLIPLFQ